MSFKKITQHILFPAATVNTPRLLRKVSGKTIVITGASYGIGEQLALLLSLYGVHLILIARTAEKLEQVQKQVLQNGSECTFIAADLYQENETDRVIAELQRLPRGIDIFISNAGKSIHRPLKKSLKRYHDFTRTNTLNYLAPVKIILAITPLLQCKKGCIINISALNVLLLPAPGWSAYQASKTAFDQWFRCNLAEWKLMGIAAKTIYLPLVKTRMIEPNEQYKHYPAMEPGQAAIRITRLICSSKKHSKPWWAATLQAAGFLGRNIWEKMAFHYLAKHNGTTN